MLAASGVALPAVRHGRRSGPRGRGRLGRADPGRRISGASRRPSSRRCSTRRPRSDCGCTWSIPERLPDMEVGPPKDVKYERGRGHVGHLRPVAPADADRAGEQLPLPAGRGREAAPGRGQGGGRGYGRLRAQGHAGRAAAVRSSARQPAGGHDEAEPFRHAAGICRRRRGARSGRRFSRGSHPRRRRSRAALDAHGAAQLRPGRSASGGRRGAGPAPLGRLDRREPVAAPRATGPRRRSTGR